jgi:phage shock protein PspC (stress-responsive transcriptional regulator)
MRLLLRAIARGRLGGWFMGVCRTLASLSGMNAVVFRLSFLLGLYLNPLWAVAAYAGLYVAIRTVDGLIRSARDDERLLEEPLSARAEPARLTGEFAALERKLAHLEAEALSSDAITRARFRSAGL